MDFVIELTVADHLQSGFLALAHWPVASLDEGQAAIAAIDALIPDDADEDPDRDDFNFILDLHQSDAWPEPNCVGNSEKLVPLQLAMRIAPDEVAAWLETRPDPDRVLNRPSPRKTIFTFS